MSSKTWHTEVYNYGERSNFSKGTPEELSEKLRKPKRENPYHKNTLKNMRAAINRYFQDNNIQDNNIKVDIVNDTKFKSCNYVLN
ncbi:hypothetical protein KUTeg_004928 [Tegillarca granosa]|uniref:Uncharacterized protein n=1 Tax=Tegillarca granosa TaxID=220873 RepID=A0ABQ9FIC9_TEGGR|nr:hypothetical protein KUTeg_004928 [Tegillarca granosa]